MANLNLNTYGDLKKVLKSISTRQKGEKIISQGKSFVLDQVLGLIPGASNAKTTFDFVKAAFKKPDAKKTGTWLDKLDIDDEMSSIVDDTVENGFMQAMAKSIEQESDTSPLEPDFNMNAKMVNYLKQQYGGRTIAGIKENQEMNLKEYIKSLVRKQLEEESTTGAIGVGAGPITSPNWVAPKGQKKNAATKYAEKEGWTVTKGETTMPGDSKLRDYVSLTGKKKKKVKIYQESGYTQASKYGAESGFTKASPSSNPSLYLQKSAYTSENMNENSNKTFKYSNKIFNVGDKVKHNGDEWIINDINTTGDMTFFIMSAPGLDKRKFDAVRVASSNVNESLLNIIKEELLNEVTYHKFKNEVKFRTKNEILHKAIREVKRKLSEIDRIVEYTSRIKQELSEGEEGLKYWKKTESNIATISEMVNQLNNKIKNLQQ